MTSVIKANRQSWVIGVLAAVALLGLALALVVGYKQIEDNSARQDDNQRVVQQLQKDLTCVETYANAQYERSVYIQEYLQPRNDAFADLELSIALNRPAAEVDEARRVFIEADARYRQAQASHPLPTPPQFVCEGLTAPKGQKAPPIPPASRRPSKPSASTTPPGTPARPTGTPRPAPSVTRGAARTVSGHVGTQTVTRTAPAPVPTTSSAGRPKGLVGPVPVIGSIICITATPGLPLLCE